MSFPDSNAVWCAQRGQLYFSPPNDQWHTWTYQLYISGDTTINGLVYHKLEESGVFDWAAYPIPTSMGSSTYFHHYKGCFREDNKVIYYMSSMSSVEGYLYNFNLNVGDTLPSNLLTNGNSTMITRIDSILISGNYRKQFFISVVDTNMWQWPTHFEYTSIIEGIGGTNGLLWTLRPYFEQSGSLWAFKHDGVLIYTYPSITNCEVTGLAEATEESYRLKLFPNPIINTLNIEAEFMKAPININIYDLEGRLLLNKNSSTNSISLDLLEISNGLYLIKAIDREGQFTIDKFIKH